MARLRNCSATVEHHDITVQIAATEELVNVPNAYILKSYSSYVAVYDNKADGTLYLLPRYDYSTTTWQHMHKFLADYAPELNKSADFMRNMAKLNEKGNKPGFVFCSGWANGTGRVWPY